MRTQPLIPLLILATLALAGCQLPTWQPGGQTHTSVGGDFTVRVPPQWMFIDRPFGLVATNDGPLLQRAGIHWQDLKTPFLYSKRTIAATVTPLELAEAIADDMRADRGLLGLEVREMAPADVGGNPGCKLVLTFHDAQNLRFTQVIYGCTTEHRRYLVHFTAPTRHYFERDAVAFEELVRSLRLLKVGTLAPYKVAAPTGAAK